MRVEVSQALTQADLERQTKSLGERSADEVMLRALPALQHYCGESVLTLKP